MESERHYYDPRYLPVHHRVQETSAWFVLSVPAVAEGVHCGTEALGLIEAYDSHRGHLDHGQQLHMSQVGDNEGQAPWEEQQPEQLPLAEQDPSDARGPQQRRPRRSRTRFKQREVKELESVFQYSPYPDVFAR